MRKYHSVESQHKELKTGKNSWINSVLNIIHPGAPLR